MKQMLFLLAKKVKRKLKSYPKVELKRIVDRISTIEYVSFDVFDTLIKRNVQHHSDVFRLTQMWYYKETGIEIRDFKTKRINAERQARKQTSEEEISLKDIYACLNDELNVEQASLLMDIEIAVEQDVCCINPNIFPVYDWCIKNGKKVIIISDMYLPQPVVEKILHDNNINNYEKFYLSSSIRKKKRTGSLYKHVLDDLGIRGEQLIHIGDSIRSDYLKAKKEKLNVYPIPKYSSNIKRDHDNKIVVEDVFAYQCIRSFINNHTKNNESLYYKFGYENFGLLLYGFCKWLLTDLKNKRINKVFFFSRDGYVIKRAFDILNADNCIESLYLYVSRRSLRVPQIWISPELKDVVSTFPLPKLLTVEIFLQNLGLELENYVDILNKYNLSPTDIIKRNEILSSDSIINFYNDIKEKVIINSKNEYDLLLAYLNQNGFLGNVAIVDIGWHGTLQHFLTEIIKVSKLEAAMHGYYIGLATEAKHDLKLSGYVVDTNSSSNCCDSWKSFNGLIETLFLAQEGSTKKYKISENFSGVIPVLYEYEYLTEGEISPEAKYVKDIQDGAIDFVREFGQSKSMKSLEFHSSAAFRNIYLTGTSPTRHDLKLFSHFRFFQEKIDFLAMPKHLFFYLVHPNELIKDLYYARWKIGFMKKLLKLPLPYDKLYYLLRKL
jgi:predicted HAD superfamily hydrolase